MNPGLYNLIRTLQIQRDKQEQLKREQAAQKLKWRDSNDSGVSLERKLQMENPSLWIQYNTPEEPLLPEDFLPRSYEGLL